MQSNNAYIFPGVGLGVVVARSSRITDEMMMIAARELAQQVTKADLDSNCLFPPLADIRRVSVQSIHPEPYTVNPKPQPNTPNPKP